MCGFSGLPKLRQLVSPSGSAPTQARFAEHSSTVSTAPRWGSAAPGGPLPSIAPAIGGRAPSASDGYRTVNGSASPDGSSSTAASAASGRRTVREPTIESYCSNAHLREATFDDPISSTRMSAGSEDVSTTGGAGYSGVAGSAGSRTYVGHSSTKAVTGMSPTSEAPSNTRSRRVSVTTPMAVPSTSQRAQTASTASSCAGSTTQSIRSC